MLSSVPFVLLPRRVTRGQLSTMHVAWSGPFLDLGTIVGWGGQYLLGTQEDGAFLVDFRPWSKSKGKVPPCCLLPTTVVKQA